MPEMGPPEPLEHQRESDPLDALAEEIENRSSSVEEPWVEAPSSKEDKIKADIERATTNPDIKKWLERLGNENSPEYDAETYAHTHGVAELIATTVRTYQKELGLNPDNLSTMVSAALLHDVGKLQPDIAALIKLPRKHTPKESEVVAKHAEYSAQMIAEDFENDPMIVALVELHHQIQANPPYDKDKQVDRLYELGLTDAYSYRKFTVMHELFEAADKCDAVARRRSYQDDIPEEQLPLEVATAMFAHFAAAGRDPETDMDMVHRVLKVKYPHLRFECHYSDDKSATQSDNVVVTYEEVH